MRTSLLLLWLSGCAASDVVAKEPPVPDAGAATASKPVMAMFWTSHQLPNGPDGLTDLPIPAGAAFLIAPGYLLAPMEDLNLVDDFDADPTVHLLVDDVWYRGEYVDYEVRGHAASRIARLALIHADVRGVPTPLAPAGAKLNLANYVGLSWTEDDGGKMLSVSARMPCSKLARGVMQRHLVEVTDSFVCATPSVPVMAGAALFDDQGRLVGFQPVSTDRFHLTLVQPVANIRRFLDTYFASWGSGIVPKPAY